jgi:hypothetical protein
VVLRSLAAPLLPSPRDPPQELASAAARSAVALVGRSHLTPGTGQVSVDPYPHTFPSQISPDPESGPPDCLTPKQPGSLRNYSDSNQGRRYFTPKRDEQRGRASSSVPSRRVRTTTITQTGNVTNPPLALNNGAATRRLSGIGACGHLLGYEPAGSRYDDLLRVGLRYCAYGLLVMQHEFRWTEGAHSALVALKPWLLRQAEGNEWPGTVRPASMPATLLVYRYDADFIDAARSLTRRLYQWEQPDLPEDLSLFRPTGEPWLGTISHEGDGWLYLTQAEAFAVEDALRPLPLRKLPPAAW